MEKSLRWGDSKKEGFKRMKKQKKWAIPITGAIVCVIVILLMHPGKVAAAAQEEMLDPMTVDYLNPFDLTVRQITVSQSASTLSSPVSVQSSPAMTSTSVTSSFAPPAPTSSYAQPLKVWIPFRPTFRSPCTPTW
jgi:hypothetical protein